MQDPQPEFRPVPGKAIRLSPKVRRILAPNPSPMTFRGTNSFLVGTRDLALIDPGPDDPAHLAALLDAVESGQAITKILVTHAHLDHSALTNKLAHATGAKVYGFGTAEEGRSDLMQALAATGSLAGGEGVDTGFRPDIRLGHGSRIKGSDWEIEALHTPGHMANHLSFALEAELFCGDLVMGWATSLVSPPDGDLTSFMKSLEMLMARGWKRFHPAHGAPVEEPQERLKTLYSHRQKREVEVLTALLHGPANAGQLARQIYTEIAPELVPMAARNVLAHLLDLMAKSKVEALGSPGFETAFRRVSDED